MKDRRFKYLSLIVTAMFSVLMSFIVSCSIHNINGSSSEGTFQTSTVQRAALFDLSSNRLTGVNWFGFETSALCPHGLWARDYRSMLKQMKDLGFNCIRLPWCNAVLTGSPKNMTISAWVQDPYTKEWGMNLDLEGLSSIQVMDKIIEEAGRLGLRIILDNHSLKPDGYMEETLWYRSDFPEEQWISDWITIVNRYINDPTIVAVDIKNEPHGGLVGLGMKPPASWGYDVPGYGITDWAAAADRCAKAILQANPNLNIVIQGVQEVSNSQTNADNYWWGGNHMNYKLRPIANVPKSQLLLSVHEYGPEVADQPWFHDANFPNNLPDVWDKHFYFIKKENIAHLYIGEIGIKEETLINPETTGTTERAIAYQWFKKFLPYLSNLHFTVWCWNADSGDTGGIVKSDWVTLETNKYNAFKPYLAPQFAPTREPLTNAVPKLIMKGMIEMDISSKTQVKLALSNDDYFKGTNISARYYMDLSEAVQAGVSPSDLVLDVYQDDSKSIVISSLTACSGLNNVYYYEMSWKNFDVLPKREFVLSFAVHFKNWDAVIDSSNDWSRIGLVSNTYVVATNIPIYCGGKLVFGKEPSGASSSTSSISSSKASSAVSSVSSTTSSVSSIKSSASSVVSSKNSSAVASSTSSINSSTASSVASSRSSAVSSAISSSKASSVASSAVSSTTSSTSSVQYTEVTAPFTFDGAGEKYWKISNIPSYINSWNLDALTINDVDIKNKYVAAGSLPAKKSDGYYYIYYKGSYAWSHVEIK